MNSLLIDATCALLCSSTEISTVCQMWPHSGHRRRRFTVSPGSVSVIMLNVALQAGQFLFESSILIKVNETRESTWFCHAVHLHTVVGA